MPGSMKMASRKAALCCLMLLAFAAARASAVCYDKCQRCRAGFGRGCLKCNADVTACLRCAQTRYVMKDGVCGARDGGCEGRFC